MNTKAQHTPGPWTHREPYGAITVGEAKSGITVAMADNHYKPTERAPFPTERDVREANARLIAAAPELLEALQDTLSLALVKWGNLEPDANQIFDKARAAISKATA